MKENAIIKKVEEEKNSPPSRIKPVWIRWRVQENCSLRMALCCKHFDSFSQHKVIEETTELQ
jgi:hypothetical protein